MKEYEYLLKAGHKVEHDGKTYYLLDNYKSSTELRAVLVDDKKTYDLICAWIRNKVREWETHKNRLQEIIVSLDSEALVPADEIRFINSRHNELFRVKSFGHILINGKKKQVYYIDEYHFGIVQGSVYHICEFAERCEKCGSVVGPCEEG